MRPREFRERYLNGTLDTFDIVFTYSSIEHSGQGNASLHQSIEIDQGLIAVCACGAKGSTAKFDSIFFI